MTGLKLIKLLRDLLISSLEIMRVDARHSERLTTNTQCAIMVNICKQVLPALTVVNMACLGACYWVSIGDGSRIVESNGRLIVHSYLEDGSMSK